MLGLHAHIRHGPVRLAHVSLRHHDAGDRAKCPPRTKALPHDAYVTFASLTISETMRRWNAALVYAAFFCAAFHFAQRTLWAAAILLRAARDMRLGGRKETLPVV